MQALSRWWKNFETKHTTVAQFIVFFVFSNGITVLQLILMPAFKAVFAHTSLVDTAFQFLPVGVSHGHTVFLFDYPAGSMSVGGGGGLAYLPRRGDHPADQRRSSTSSPAQRHLQVQLVRGQGGLLVHGRLRRHHDRRGCAPGPLQGPDLRVGDFGDGRGRRDRRGRHHDDHQRGHLLLVFFPIFKVIFKQEATPEDAQSSEAQ